MKLDAARELVDAVADRLVAVDISNWYSDGHESEKRVFITLPDIEGLTFEALEEWLEDEIFRHTGDGHGVDSSLGSCYTAVIVDAADKRLIGKSYEWTD